MATYGRQDEVWDAMGDRTRRAILERLAEHPCPVGELAAQLPVSRPAVSQHLKVLKESGLVSDETVGTRRVYRLNPAGVQALRDQLDMFWNRALANYDAAVRGDAEAGGPERNPERDPEWDPEKEEK
ncbi:ArsR/SmtB family transcription factor [Sinomonas sp. P47F7]|uniref:ArsR/SmtB family transcription factor n=1 Tax=Sinomonas sp. P47F7 TaxID=3410987 RepID=UPI003BF4A6F2